MRILIVESDASLRTHWAGHMRSLGWDVHEAADQAGAVKLLTGFPFGAMVLNLILAGGSSLAVADFAGYRQPDLKVIFVTNTSVFSDGSIFNHCSNAGAFLQTDVPVEDLAAVAEHHARAA